MSDSYNGRPYKVGFLQEFKQMPPSVINEMVMDLGLTMPVAHLTTYRNLFKKNDYRYTIDELYMADALYAEAHRTDVKYSISTFCSKNDEINEAFADIMEKRRAMCDSSPVTLTSLVSDYNSYLCEQGYDDGADGCFTVAPLSNTDAPATTMKNRTVGSFYTHGNAPYAIARVTKPSRFCTDEMRIRMGTYGTASLSVILIKLGDAPLMYELLSDVVNALPALCTNVTYFAPVANTGLLRRLSRLGVGFSLNLDQVARIFPEIDRPHLLARPMAAAVLIAPPLAAGSIVSELLRVNFECEIIGTSTSMPNLISVSYGGFTHALDVNALDHVLFTRPLRVFAFERETESQSKCADGISLSVFDGSDFSHIHRVLCDSIATLCEENANARLTSYVCLPFSAESADESLTAFLAVYRALAESAIPIRLLTTFDNKENNRLCVFITDEDRVLGKNAQ